MQSLRNSSCTTNTRWQCRGREKHSRLLISFLVTVIVLICFALTVCQFVLDQIFNFTVRHSADAISLATPCWVETGSTGGFPVLSTICAKSKTSSHAGFTCSVLPLVYCGRGCLSPFHHFLLSLSVTLFSFLVSFKTFLWPNPLWSVVPVSSQPSQASVFQLAHRAGGNRPVHGLVLRGPKQVQSALEAQLQEGLQRRGQQDIPGRLNSFCWIFFFVGRLR